MSKISAVTAMGGNYPPYINATEDVGSNEVQVTLRGDRKKDGTCGDSVTATFSQDEWQRFKEALS